MDTFNFPFCPTTGCPSRHQLIEVDAGSPADKAGLKTGDFIVEVCLFFMLSFLKFLFSSPCEIYFCSTDLLQRVNFFGSFVAGGSHICILLIVSK